MSSVDDPRYQDPFVKGLNTGIYFLIAMPFLLAGTVGGILYLAHRSRRKAEGNG